MFIHDARAVLHRVKYDVFLQVLRERSSIGAA
jgi:hypothetical protein